MLRATGRSGSTWAPRTPTGCCARSRRRSPWCGRTRRRSRTRTWRSSVAPSSARRPWAGRARRSSTATLGRSRPVADRSIARERGAGAAAGVPRRGGRAASVSAIAVIAHRDFVKLLRDRLRLVSELTFPLILVLVLGPALQAGFGEPGGVSITTYVFTGVLAQTIWQSAVLGLVSLLADREED